MLLQYFYAPGVWINIFRLREIANGMSVAPQLYKKPRTKAGSSLLEQGFSGAVGVKVSWDTSETDKLQWKVHFYRA